MESYSLFELNEFLRRIINLNFPAPLWVNCEIAQINESKGHYYLNLIQKEEEDIIARSSAAIWRNTYLKLKRKLGKNLKNLLQNGVRVLVKVTVNYHENHGLKLIIEDIDPAYTIGQLEIQRRAAIQELEKENLIHKNAQIALPAILKNIAVISSETAAGYQDFIQQLSHNEYGYAFKVQLFPAAVQGINAVGEITHQLEKIHLSSHLYDCVVLVRGGGARLDLMAFDDIGLAKLIAHCPIPVLSGIGHDVDETLCDRVAAYALKTPTAAATFIIEKNLYFESTLLETAQWIQSQINETVQSQSHILQQLEQQLIYSSQLILKQESRMLDYLEQELPRLIELQKVNANKELDTLEKMVQLLNPTNVLKRGYSITLQQGKIIRSIAQLQPDEVIETHLAGGIIHSKYRE